MLQFDNWLITVSHQFNTRNVMYHSSTLASGCIITSKPLLIQSL